MPSPSSESRAAPPRAENPLLARLGRLLEAVLARAVALDPALPGQLAALEGRRIGVDLRGTGLAFAVEARAGRLTVGPHDTAPAQLSLRAAPASLLAFALRGSDAAPLPPGRVEIAGDADLARRVETLLRGYRPDIEEAFARVFGDVIGVPLSRAFSGAFARARRDAHAFAEDAAAFVRDETGDAVGGPELDGFLDDVDALRERADRLAARVAGVAGRMPRA